MSSSEVSEWLARHYAQVDGGQTDDYSEDFADDVVLSFAGGAAIEGKARVIDALVAGHQKHRMTHRIDNVWESGSTVIAEFFVRYDYPDGRSASFPAVTVMEREGGLIKGMRVYLDTAAASGH